MRHSERPVWAAAALVLLTILLLWLFHPQGEWHPEAPRAEEAE